MTTKPTTLPPTSTPSTTSQPPTTPTPPSTPQDDADKALDEACAAVGQAAKKHDKAATALKRTISNPQLRAIRLPTPSQLELEAQKK